MSGVASIGSFVKLHTPAAAIANVSDSISHRWAMAKRMTRSRRGMSVFMAGTLFLEVGFDEIALFDHDLFTGSKAFQDLGVVRVPLAEFHGARRVGVTVAHEYDAFVFEGLQRGDGYD